jgi:hypothetical protein
VARIGVNCRSCFRFVGYGREAGPCGGIEWIEQCDWCVERALRARVEVGRLEEMWASRECAAADCQVVFTPAKVGQRFCCDRCRKRTHWRLKAASQL